METDRLSKDAQHALRRTMEKYVTTCRLILCCNSTSKVIPAIRSRCLGVRVAAPSNEEVHCTFTLQYYATTVNLYNPLTSSAHKKINCLIRLLNIYILFHDIPTLFSALYPYVFSRPR